MSNLEHKCGSCGQVVEWTEENGHVVPTFKKGLRRDGEDIVTQMFFSCTSCAAEMTELQRCLDAYEWEGEKLKS